MYLAGPALVKAAIGQRPIPRSLAAPACTPKSAARPITANRTTTLVSRRLRSLIALLPLTVRSNSLAMADPDASGCSANDRSAPERDPQDVYQIVSADGPAEYEARDMLACVVDAGSLQEFRAEYRPHRGDGLSPASTAGRSAWWPTSGIDAALPAEKCRSAACCTAIRPRRPPAS